MQVSPELVEIRASGAPASKWQQPFDAAITDVFQVQSDIATKVAQALGGALAAGEEKRLSEKPTQNLAAYDAFLKGEEACEWPGSQRSPQPAQGARLLRAGRGAGPRLRAGVGEDLDTPIRSCTPTALPRRRSPSAPGRRPRRPSPLRRTARRDTWRSVTTNDWSPRTSTAALEQYEKGLRVAPGDASLLSGTALAEQGLGRWDAAVERLRQAERLDPRSVSHSDGVLATHSSGCGAIPRRGRPSTVPSPSRPPTSRLIESRAMTFLGEGDLPGARAVLEAAPRERRAHRPGGLPGVLLGSRLGSRRGAAGAPAAADTERVRRRPRHLGSLPHSGLCPERRCGERAYVRRGGKAGLRGAASRGSR